MASAPSGPRPKGARRRPPDYSDRPAPSAMNVATVLAYRACAALDPLARLAALVPPAR
jgi:hypothetical protein